MSGHSKWHNIQKTKGAQDAKRAAAFTKIAKEMYVAVKEGGGSTDPSYNSRTSHRRPHALPNLTVAAFPAQPLAALPLYGCGVPLAGSDRLVQSHSTAGGHWCTAALPDVSLRGPEGAVAP